MRMASYSTPIRLSRPKRSRMGLKKIKENPIQKPVTEMGLINGRQPGSSYEWNISQALDRYGWRYYYQLSVMGGSNVRGGQVLDFLIFTRPFAVALQVIGGYWHRDGMKEQLKNSQIIQGLRHMGYGVGSEVLSAFDTDADTMDNAAAFIYKYIGRA
jgi:hypothetical protein